jgi:hypothetical protein
MDMKDDYLIKVDEIVMEAFYEGVIAIGKDVWEDYAIRYRLLLYGEIRDNYYSLNELGIRYVMDGCSEGIKRKQVKDEYINDLNIEATKKSMYDADRAFIQSEKSLAESKNSNNIAKWALGLSILSIFVQVFQEQIRELFSLLFQILKKGLEGVTACL